MASGSTCWCSPVRESSLRESSGTCAPRCDELAGSLAFEAAVQARCALVRFTFSTPLTRLIRTTPRGRDVDIRMLSRFFRRHGVAFGAAIMLVGASPTHAQQP